MRTRSKLLLLFLVISVSCSEYEIFKSVGGLVEIGLEEQDIDYSYKRGPCPIKDDKFMNSGTWKKAHPFMMKYRFSDLFDDFTYTGRHYKKENVRVVVDGMNDVVIYYNEKTQDMCYNEESYCGYFFNGYRTRFKALQNCNRHKDCTDENGKPDGMLTCSVGVCCPRASYIVTVMVSRLPNGISFEDLSWHNKACKEGTDCDGYGPCINVVKDKFFKYFQTTKENYFRCIKYDESNYGCPYGYMPKWANNRLYQTASSVCPDGTELFFGYEAQAHLCCPILLARIGEKNPLVVKVKPSESIPCMYCDQQKNGVCVPIAKTEGELKHTKNRVCVNVPKCEAKDESFRNFPTNVNYGKFNPCDSWYLEERCKGVLSYCAAGNLCCEIDCPFITRNRHGANYHLPKDGICYGSHLYFSRVFGHNICCYVDDAYMDSYGQLPAIPERGYFKDKNNKNEKIPHTSLRKIKLRDGSVQNVAYYDWESSEYKGLSVVIGGRYCRKHSECNDSGKLWAFCGLAQMVKSVKSRATTTHMCFHGPNYPEGTVLLGEDFGLSSCNTNADCKYEGPEAVDCMPDKNALKTGKICVKSKCGGFEVFKPNFNCKDYSDCIDTKSGKNYDCFKTELGTKHCCATQNRCPIGEERVPYVPTKDGKRNSDLPFEQVGNDCKQSEYYGFYNPNIPDLKHCCPRMKNKIIGDESVKYDVQMLLDDMLKKTCKSISDCDKNTEFCGESVRMDGRPMPKTIKQCYKRPMCSGNYISSLQTNDDVVGKCTKLSQCIYDMTYRPRYCDTSKGKGICCNVEKEMCPYWTKQGKSSLSNLAKCDNDCKYDGEQCTDIPRIGKRCCYTDEDTRCPHDQPPALNNFKQVDVRKCSTFHLYKYTTQAKIDVCCRFFQYADITENVEPLLNDKAAKDQYGQEVVCKTHKDCRKNEFCGMAAYYKREPNLSVKPAPKVYLCFPLPKHEGIMAMKDEEAKVGLKFCDTPKKCTGAKDAVACERGKVGKMEELTTEKMCFEKKCPFGMKSPQPTVSCTSNSHCAKGSICTPIGVSKHCCPITDEQKCWESHDPVPITSKGCHKEVSVEPHPDSEYTSICCPKFQLKAFGFKKQRLYTQKSAVSCQKHSQCSGQEFCGFSTVSTGTMKKELKHCYKRPVFEGVAASLKDDAEEIQTCTKPENCNAQNPVVCEVGTIDGDVVEGKKFCFEMACAFGEQPSDTSKTCKTNKDCGNEICVKTFSSKSHCCRTGANDIKCPTGQPPVMGAGNDPHGKCDSTAKQVAIKNKNYCCPLMTYKLPKRALQTHNSAPCASGSDCKKDEFCGQSSRLDNQPMLKSVKHCYKIPACTSSFTGGYALMRNGEPVRASNNTLANTNNECSFTGLKPHFASYHLLCCPFVDCPYWSKVVKGNRLYWPGNNKCKGKTVATNGSVNYAITLCCPIDEDKMCPGDQVPVMVDNKVPTKCPSDTVQHPSHSDVCCRPLQSKDVKINNKPARPEDDGKLCKNHKDCADDEFCGYSEFATEKTTLIGTPSHCYKIPSFNGISATLERSIGIFKCSKASDCTGASQPVVCEKVNGEGFCFEKPCPFGSPAKNAAATCTDHKSCGSDSLCTSVHKSTKHCCLVSSEFRCHNLQIPFMLAESGGCKEGSVPHTKMAGVCCQPFIYKHLADILSLSPVKGKECISHGECDPTHFCGDSTMAKMENRVAGSPRHCYNKPQNSEKLYASTSPDSNIMLCNSDNECKTSHPSICDTAFIDGKEIKGVKMCFEKKCPFGGVAPTSLTNCESDSECSSETLCTHVIGAKKHCCPVSNEFKCYGRQIPYVKPNSKGCEDLSVAYNSLCCQRFIFRDFGEATPLFAVNNENECSVHKDCNDDEFCGESVLHKMPGKTVGSPKHCYKKPEYEKGLAIADKDLGLLACQDDVDCSSTHPVVCVTLQIEGKPVAGKKFCVEKSCNGGTTKEPHHTCKSHMECAKDEALCEAVFGTRKYCCQPGKDRRCYGSQLPYVKDGQSEDVLKCEDGSIHMNGICCQRFISKEYGIQNPLYTRENEKECTAHTQCSADEFCGYSTLEHMDGLVIGSPQHCFKTPTFDGVKAILKQTVGIATCNDASECASSVTDAVVCEAVDNNDNVKFCFEKQCPYGESPKDPAQTCSSDTECKAAICTQVFGKVKHCCPVTNSLKCFNTQLPYEKVGASSCDDGMKHHDEGKKLCCRNFINKVLGDENTVFPANQKKECKSNADCAYDHFCAQSTVQKAPELLLGKPKHCYPRPVFDKATPLMDASGLKSCKTVTDCKNPNPTVCTGGRIGKDEIRGVKICYEKPCPFGALSTASIQCNDSNECTDGVCYNVFSSVKHCCPSGSEFACHKDQDPYPEKPGPDGCVDGSFIHPMKKDVCCQTFTYALFNEAPVFEPTILTSCKTSDNCKNNEFCGESMLRKMKTKNHPRHCYPLPMINGKNAMIDSNNELITCDEAKSCPGDNVANCSAPRLPSGDLTGVSICYEAKCPLWDKKIDRSLIKDCSQQSDCGDFGSTHCVNLFGQKKCCPVEEKFLCPGDVPALLDQNDYALDVCNSDQHFEKTVDGKSYCCAIPVSAGYVAAAGIDVESLDGQKSCKQNSDCAGGYFCGASVSKVEHIAFGNDLKHCYPVPTGIGGIRREDDGNGITPCNSHEDCKVDNGEYCNKELGKKYFKGICHLAKCPLAEKLTGKYTSCSTDSDCGNEQCHPISGKEKGCCTVDEENLCPGGLLPVSVGEKSCSKEHFSFKSSNGVNICCRKVISDTLKAAGSEWPVTLSNSDKDLISAMGSNCPCKEGFFCDKSAALGGSKLEKELKLCYPVPNTHGTAVSGPPEEIKTCKDSSDCDTAKGEICDTQIHKIEKNVKEGTGICSKFVCPLSPSSLVSPGSDFKSGQNLCEANKKCGTDKECQPVGKNEIYQACCGVDDEFTCPGGILPRKYKDKMVYIQGLIRCHATNEYPYEFGIHATNPADTARCCPNVISRDIYKGSYEGEKRDIVYPSKQDKICQKHEDCEANEFCGESMLAENQETGEELIIKGAKVHHCYKKPKCSGKTVLLGKVGLKVCTASSTDACGENEICDFNLGDFNNNEFRNTGVCCHFNCKGSYTESKESGPWKAGKICDNCEGETEDQLFCDSEAKGDEHSIKICEKTEVGNYRLCTYERDPVTCGSDLPVRSSAFDLLGCEHDIDCRILMKQEDPSSYIQPRCSNPSRTIPGFAHSKICCQADLCSDFFTVRKDQKTCTDHKDCSFSIGTFKKDAKCEGGSLGKDETKHCCPHADSSDGVDPDVAHPFRINKKCSSLADCIGYRRFCDPLTNQCMYNSRRPRQPMPVKTCAKTDKDCGDPREVCMTQLEENSDAPPECYYHPLDTCITNNDCLDGYYCAPAVGTKEEEYNTAFRQCHKNPKSVATDPEQFGLDQCKTSADCKDPSKDVCDTSMDDVAVRPGFGFCKLKEEITCRGNPLLTYVKGKLLTCTKNNDCNSENHYCDMDIKRAKGWAKDQGICCSKPTDVAGDVPKIAVGIKICKNDEGCDALQGEICDKNIQKPEGSTWKEDEGVCAQMNCPATTNPEVVLTEITPAGPLCEVDNCQSDSETIKSCVPSPNKATKLRCCSYKRNRSLCPADTKETMRSGFDAMRCTVSNDCPSGAACFDGWCCKLDLCSDGFTLKKQQPICAEASVEGDCGQPSGASASCEDGYCCPINADGKIEKPYVTATECESPTDCPVPMMYCHDELKKCVHFGNRPELQTKIACAPGNNTCPNQHDLPGICVFYAPGIAPLCFADPLAQKAPKAEALRVTTPKAKEEPEEKSSTGMIIGIVAAVVVVVAMAGIGIFVFFKYRQHKKNKAEQEESKNKNTKKDAKKDTKKDAKKPAGPSKKYQSVSEVSMISEVSQGSQVSAVSGKEQPGVKDENSKLESDKPPNPNAPPPAPQAIAL